MHSKKDGYMFFSYSINVLLSQYHIYFLTRNEILIALYTPLCKRMAVV